MNGSPESKRLDALLRDIELPDPALDLAEKRYLDIGEWISSPGSSLADYDAHVFVQGSFALGTAIRPINGEEEYDLDLTCKLRAGVTRDTHTQAQLKKLVGTELAAYRRARGIDKPLTSKRRCWRLSYKDEMPFHMDVVPGIRADQVRRGVLTERMVLNGIERPLAEQIARKALWITDDEVESYEQISPDWPSSNPGGYQQWFLSRMRTSEQRGILAEAQVDPVPVFRDKTPLHQTVQLLKRHRDVTFAESTDLKPASILITTIAGLACRPGESLETTLARTLEKLRVVRDSGTSDIPNPINPKENFADRWTGRNCPLRIAFYRWIDEANRAFDEYLTASAPQRLLEIAEDHFRVDFASDTARQLAGGSGILVSAPAVKLETTPPSPWCG